MKRLVFHLSHLNSMFINQALCLLREHNLGGLPITLLQAAQSLTIQNIHLFIATENSQLLLLRTQSYFLYPLSRLDPADFHLFLHVSSRLEGLLSLFIVERALDPNDLLEVPHVPDEDSVPS